MKHTSDNKKINQLCIGVLAHVDAGKTTLSEGILYQTGKLRTLGRVDNQDAFLDTDEMERKRGITIFSKQAIFQLGDKEVTLLDTPGHVDFSAEMERTLQVLDYAILVISGADGVQGHTATLWDLLKKYQIPTFLFINKMDQDGTNQDALMEELKRRLDEECIDFTTKDDDFFEAVAMTDENVLEDFLEHGEISDEQIQRMIDERKIFPCFFGAALKVEGVDEFLEGLDTYTKVPTYENEFAARVFKITRDDKGNRLTHMKITGGSLQVKSVMPNTEEKINEIRIYSGEKYETRQQVSAGTICVVTGLSKSKPGDGYGMEAQGGAPVLEPVLTYQLILPDSSNPVVMLPKLYELEEEEPELHIVWMEDLQEIQVQIMGQVQLEILQSLIKERFDVFVSFGEGHILYKETITQTVEGVGHFEPLRHYAEVHLLLEPGEEGSGLVFGSNCSEDMLDKNWQRLILTHLQEREIKGVLTGSPLTDTKISIVAGKAHQKHTEGGDFRQATYRALRQGLMQTQSNLLEPYYEFRLEVPQGMIGRAMTDLEQMHAVFESPEIEGDMSIIIGSGSVSTMQEYPKEVTAYTRGEGRIFCRVKGYGPCHNEEEVIAQFGYDADGDLNYPSSSVFCAHGSGYYVSWDEVFDHMHVESVLKPKQEEIKLDEMMERKAYIENEWIDTEEVDRIIAETFYANSQNKRKWTRKKVHHMEQDYQSYAKKASVKRDVSKKYLLVDGYNIIYAWDELRELANINIDSARGKLLDILSDYHGTKTGELIVVFDAYRVKGHETEIVDYHNIHIVYTKEAQTADGYIEQFAHEHGRKYDVTVATSDGMEQIIIRGQGCRLLSARELLEEVERTKKEIRETYLKDE